MFVHVDHAEGEAGHDDADNTDVVADTVINPGNQAATYQRDRLTQLYIAPRSTEVPEIFSRKIFFTRPIIVS